MKTPIWCLAKYRRTTSLFSHLTIVESTTGRPQRLKKGPPPERPLVLRHCQMRSSCLQEGMGGQNRRQTVGVHPKSETGKLGTVLDRRTDVARELKVQRNDLYVWRNRFRSGGSEGLRGPGRPRKAEAGTTSDKMAALDDPMACQLDAAHKCIAELERKVGRQQLELDFFRQALRQVKGARRPSEGSGVTGSTRSCKR